MNHRCAEGQTKVPCSSRLQSLYGQPLPLFQLLSHAAQNNMRYTLFSWINNKNLIKMCQCFKYKSLNKICTSCRKSLRQDSIIKPFSFHEPLSVLAHPWPFYMYIWSSTLTLSPYYGRWCYCSQQLWPCFVCFCICDNSNLVLFPWWTSSHWTEILLFLFICNLVTAVIFDLAERNSEEQDVSQHENQKGSELVLGAGWGYMHTVLPCLASC